MVLTTPEVGFLMNAPEIQIIIQRLNSLDRRNDTPMTAAQRERLMPSAHPTKSGMPT
jgi:hypothetical protein